MNYKKIQAISSAKAYQSTFGSSSIIHKETDTKNKIKISKSQRHNYHAIFTITTPEGSTEERICSVTYVTPARKEDLAYNIANKLFAWAQSIKLKFMYQTS